MDFPMIARRDADPGKYWSSLYKAVWKVIKQKKAVLDREFQYSLEPQGYPPIDVHEVVAARFGRRNTFRSIPKLVPQLNQTLTFWVVPGQYSADTATHEEIIQNKINLYVQLGQIRANLGHALVEMIEQAAKQTDLTCSTKLTEVRDWNGKKLSTSEGAIDVVLISLPHQAVYGIEAKNLAQIIEASYVTRRLIKHISNCNTLGMKPVFIVSRIFPTAAKKLTEQGALVIETQAQFYQKRYWALAKNLKQSLGYHFVRRVGHRKLVDKLSQKLSAALVPQQ